MENITKFGENKLLKYFWGGEYMPVWIYLITNTLLPGIVLFFMLYDNRKNKKCVDISVWVVGWFVADVCYRINEGLYTKSELIILVLGNYVIYVVYWVINMIILSKNRAKLQKK